MNAIALHNLSAAREGRADIVDRSSIDDKRGSFGVVEVWRSHLLPQNDEPPQRRRVGPAEGKIAPQVLTLDKILDVLERHHQRATFGAVAGVLGREPRFLFNGYERTPKTEWVVNKTTGLPTGMKKSDYPDELLQNKRVIDAPDELRVWLQEHR